MAIVVHKCLFAATAVHKSHAPQTPCDASFGCSHDVCDACDAHPVAAENSQFKRIFMQQFSNAARKCV
eukprot:10228895-Lingulodinium_polyedra.AAC.1